MVTALRHRRRDAELPLLAGERELASYPAAALQHSWAIGAGLVLTAAVGLVTLLSRTAAGAPIIASFLSSNVAFLAALSRRKLVLTNRRLMLRRGQVIEKALDLSAVTGIDVRGRRIGGLTISAQGGTLTASVYAPLIVAGEIQAACIAANARNGFQGEGDGK